MLLGPKAGNIPAMFPHDQSAPAAGTQLPSGVYIGRGGHAMFALAILKWIMMQHGKGTNNTASDFKNTTESRQLRQTCLAAPIVSQKWIFLPEGTSLMNGTALVPKHLYKDLSDLVRKKCRAAAQGVPVVPT